MKILKELDQTERADLRIRHENVDTSATHIDLVIDMAHCFEIELVAADFSRILIYAGGRNRYLSDVIRQIINNRNILKRPFWEYGLHGHIIEKHLWDMEAYEGTSQEYFHSLLGCFMIDRGDGSRIYDVTDGQHRLVAYGLATGMNESHFPIKVYWGTDKNDIKL
jgi:hypothetical protein